VRSPRAAKVLAAGCDPCLKVEARVIRFCFAPALGLLGDILLDVLHLLSPAFVVADERFPAPAVGDVTKSGLGDFEERAGRGFLEMELDERGRFL